ncbi:MAG: hypothetical protein A2Y48_09275 [Nitrospirae bacterium RIFCSPLOW2_12_42_9]|nr:MAG: hypothetical protein A2035_01145 [Nitrospirae bacterium GWA2_42_11]OGW54360.1 MAG: hypothetical protein A2Z60_03555 [Nitrospirae bacterium RIFCSPLOWO2_02_42_7]OGW58913.1 MAG: hypothetical protein A2Y48_09275 [Nitrospirae bacterium RIFCSPLOW2_12_42_9]OGW60203.1 MAG: hypothetical protein A3D21_04610 [Nitrospirae bacterium RIFCSPHIGHO2_02_FULL_42_12]HAS18336.1 hypothetical protein [Nitrospiraceae bacterium]
MDKDFINRSLKVSTIVAIIFAPFLLLYFNLYITMGIMAGAIWNIVNILLLSQIFTMFTSPEKLNKKWAVLAGIIKFPVLYGGGYAIIKYTNISLYGIIAGFPLVLAVFVLRVLGIYFKKNPVVSYGIFRGVKK